MAKARLLSLTLERFKSYEAKTIVKFAPLTVVLGKNNSGKSSIIQALLLLKQSLMLPRPEVPLRFEPLVNAFSLRDLTFGWPEPGTDAKGPRIELTWRSEVDIAKALDAALSPKLDTIIQHAPKLSWLKDDGISPKTKAVITRLSLDFADRDGRVVLTSAEVANVKQGLAFRVEFTGPDGSANVRWMDERTKSLGVELEHFIPYLTIDRRNIGPRHRARAQHNAYLIVFAQALEDLKSLLLHFGYLGAMRHAPQMLYRSESVPPEEIGVSGELAAEMLRSRQHELVHFPLPALVEDDDLELPDMVEEAPLGNAVNSVMNALGVAGKLRVEDVQNVGFKLLFGEAALPHVGRGVSYLMPVVELGLLSDPLRFRTVSVSTREEYLNACPGWSHFAIEEGEAHLHPRVQSRLAQWLVALARANRQIIVETHSDHLVRRLRGMIARAPDGSEAEEWLAKNVAILTVEQDDQGRSHVERSTLTKEGAIEDWPAEFMDEATDEEAMIYRSRLKKLRVRKAAQPASKSGPSVEHDVGDEPETHR